MSARIARVSDGPVPNCKHTDYSLLVVKLIDDPVRANSERSEPPETASKYVACFGLSLEKAERLDNRVGQWPVEIEDLLTSPPHELYSAHLWPAAVEFQTELR